MRRSYGVLLLGLALSAMLTGCAVLLLGAGAAGGYAISKDSVKNTFDLSKDLVFRQSLAVAKALGEIKTEDQTHGKIELRYGPANVTITVKQLTRRTVELTVKARNDVLLPEVDRAQELYSKILERL